VLVTAVRKPWALGVRDSPRQILVRRPRVSIFSPTIMFCRFRTRSSSCSCSTFLLVEIRRRRTFPAGGPPGLASVTQVGPVCQRRMVVSGAGVEPQCAPTWGRALPSARKIDAMKGDRRQPHSSAGGSPRHRPPHSLRSCCIRWVRGHRIGR